MPIIQLTYQSVRLSLNVGTMELNDSEPNLSFHYTELVRDYIFIYKLHVSK
jgi:hypothetical protein